MGLPIAQISKFPVMKAVGNNAVYGGGLPNGVSGVKSSVPVTTTTTAKSPKGTSQQKNEVANAKHIDAVMKNDQGGIVRVVDGAESVVQKIFNYQFMGGMILPFIGGTSEFLAKVGETKYIGAPFRGLSKVIGGLHSAIDAPINFANQHKLNESIVGLAGGADSLTKKVTKNQYITGTASDLRAATEKNATNINTAIGTAYDTITTPFAKAGDALEKPLSPFAKRTLNKINNKHIPDIQEAITNIQSELSKHTGELRSHSGAAVHVKTLENAITGLTEHLHADGVPDNKIIKSHIADFHKALGELGELENTSESFNNALKKVSGVLENKKTTKGFVGKIKNIFASTPSATIEKAGIAFENYKILSKPGDAVRASKNMIANTDLHTLSMNTAFTLGMVAQSTHTAHDLHSQIKDLVNLSAALEGKKSSSVLHVFTSSDVPKPIKQARSQILHSFGPRMVTEAIAAVFNIKMMRGGMGMAAMAGLVAPSMINSVIQPKNQLLPVLHQMNLAQKAGQPIDREMYAQLLVAGSEEVAKNGGADNLLTRSVAEAYAVEQISPTDVLKEIDSGKMNIRATEIQKKLHENGHKFGEVVPEAVEKHNAELAEKAKIYGADKVDKPTEIKIVAEPNISASKPNNYVNNVPEIPVKAKPKQDIPTTNISHIATSEPLISNQITLG